MSAVAGTSHFHMDRRSFLTGLGAAALVGSATTVGAAMPARASSPNTFANAAAPKPIPVLIGPTGAPAPFDFIHWTLPGPIGAKTQINELDAFGLDVHRSTIWDYEGFTTYAVIAGTTESSEGRYDVELDIRVMDGKYIGMDGRQYRGTFGFF